MKDYKGKDLKIGDPIKNIESGWHGVIQSTEVFDGELMLVCLGVNWWDGSLDQDDKQWHSPADVVKSERLPTSISPLNFL